MEQLKENSLNGLLAVLVLLSIFLSSLVWFPWEQIGRLGPGEARIQVPPPVQQGQMPDVYRPERIYVSTADSQAVMLQLGDVDYDRAWWRSEGILTNVTAGTSPIEVEEPWEEAADTITLVLPIALTLAEWADRWDWDIAGLRNPSIKIDRVIFRLDSVPAVYLSGPGGQQFLLTALSQEYQGNLTQLISYLQEGNRYAAFRPLLTKELTARILPEVRVPDVTDVPRGRVVARLPDPDWEEIRHFPDLSVVRQIDEKDARSFTDGQRLLRLAASGILDYRTPAALQEYSAPDQTTTAPLLPRAEKTAKDWVDTHGGWPQEVVLGMVAQEPGRTTLVYEVRTKGPYPIETAGGALLLQVAADRVDSAADQIVAMRRYPELMPIFEGSSTPIITPEVALQSATRNFPRLLLFEVVREVHLAYLVQPGSRTDEPSWMLEPVWVIQAGADRVYVPAVQDSELKPFQASARIIQ